MITALKQDSLRFEAEQAGRLRQSRQSESIFAPSAPFDMLPLSYPDFERGSDYDRGHRDYRDQRRVGGYRDEDPRMDSRLDPRMDYRLSSKTDSRLDSRTGSRLDSRMDYRLDSKTDSRLDSRTGSRLDSRM